VAVFQSLGDEGIRPFSALISNLGCRLIAPENRSGLAKKTASFALGYEPRLRPDQFDSPGVTAGQQIVSPKKGGYCSSILRGVSGQASL